MQNKQNNKNMKKTEKLLKSIIKETEEKIPKIGLKNSLLFYASKIWDEILYPLQEEFKKLNTENFDILLYNEIEKQLYFISENVANFKGSKYAGSKLWPYAFIGDVRNLKGNGIKDYFNALLNDLNNNGEYFEHIKKLY